MHPNYNYIAKIVSVYAVCQNSEWNNKKQKITTTSINCFPNLFHSRECGERPAADNLLIQIRKLRGNHRRDLALHLNVSFHSCVRRVRKREGKKEVFLPTYSRLISLSQTSCKE